MDRRKNYYIVLDTETCNGIMTDEGLDLSCSLVYDIGWQVIDKQGNVYEKRSFIIDEIFNDEREMMNSAYYANKIPMYEKELAEGKRTLTHFYNVRRLMFQDCRTYDIKAIIAHNAPFDYNATNNTQRWLTKSKYRYFLPYGIPIFDTMKMALDTIAKEKGYNNFCEREGFMTKHKNPRPRVTAEILYKYITGDYDFKENHTGLEDVEIESVIFTECMKKHKRMRKGAWEKQV